MKYIQLTFSGLENDSKEIATALLNNSGAYGFEENGSNLKAFFTESEFNEEALKEVYNLIGQQPVKETIEEENWNAQWESSFEPVFIPFAENNELYAVIRASFHHLSSKPKHDIIITPRMSFGTGHHATTFLMVQEMSKLQFEGKEVFDFGTGTGVLAVIACREGGKVVAVDYDDNCIQNAKDNFIENNCDITLSKADTIDSDARYDIILANINRNVILENINRIFNALKPSGSVLFSGMLAADEEKVLPVIINAGLKFERSVYKDQWWMLHASR